MIKLNRLLALAIIGVGFTAHANVETTQAATERAASSHVLNQYEKMMTGKVWLTTEALNQAGKKVDGTEPQVSNYFGIAEYFTDGSFKMLTPDGKPKMQGTWSMSDDGKTRTLIAKDADGKVLFTRTVENIKVTPSEYTYRIYPNADSKNEFFDIVHKPE